MHSLIATTTASVPAAASAPAVHTPAGILAILLAVLALIFWMTQHPVLGRVFKVVPALIFCYFVPTTLTTLNIIPASSPLYEWVKAYVLPASLLLLILALDLPGIMRLGPKAVIMLLAGTAGVVIGGPIALWITQDMLPDDAWQGMTALCGSWIGGGANFVALGKIAGASDSMIATMVIPDVFVANCWMAVLLYFSVIQHRIDRWTRADASAIRDLERRMTDFQERVARIPGLADLMIILAFGFAASWVCMVAADGIHGTMERRLTVDVVKLRPTDPVAAAAFIGLEVEGSGEDRQRVLTLATICQAGDLSLTEAAAASLSGTTTDTAAKLRLSADELDSLGELVDYIRRNVTGWQAHLATDDPAVAELPTSALRGVSRTSVGQDGLELRVPDPASPGWWNFHSSFGATTWKFVFITTLGVLLSFTRVRNLEGAGASKIGSVMIYLLVACIGAHADFTSIGEQPAYILMGFIWMACHIIVLLTVAWLIRAPIFFVAVGSQANIGGAASAPVVAAAYHPSLAPVGALLAVLGYVLGTYAGLVCMYLLKAVAGGG